MQSLDLGLVKDIPWLYFPEGNDGEPQTVMVEKIIHKTVYLDNGDQIPADKFYDLCEKAVDDTPMVSEEQQQMEEVQSMLDLDTGDGASAKPAANYNPIDEMIGAVKFDANGIPIEVGKPDKHQSATIVRRGGSPNFPVQNTHTSPLIALIEKGQFGDTELTIKLRAPAVKKILFNALVETYPEEEIDMLLEYLVDKIGMDNIRQAIKLKMQQYYKPKKDVTA